jgi:acetoin utilization protein AcuB
MPSSARGLPARSVIDVMRRRFIALAAADTLLDAERLMRVARVRCLPVVDGVRLVGMLSNRELLESSLAPSHTSPEALGRYLLETHVAQLMDAKPKVVSPETPLRSAARLVLESGEGCVAVVEAAGAAVRLVGILTETDLLRAAYPAASGGAAA